MAQTLFQTAHQLTNTIQWLILTLDMLSSSYRERESFLDITSISISISILPLDKL